MLIVPDTADLYFPNLPCQCRRSKYREAGFYVSHMPEDNDASEKFYGLGDAGFKDAVMDLTAEDAGGQLII